MLVHNHSLDLYKLSPSAPKGIFIGHSHLVLTVLYLEIMQHCAVIIYHILLLDDVPRCQIFEKYQILIIVWITDDGWRMMLEILIEDVLMDEGYCYTIEKFDNGYHLKFQKKDLKIRKIPKNLYIF